MKVKIEVSARHIHLCQKDIEFLFGQNYKLGVKRELSQSGQFLSNEKLTIQNQNYSNTSIKNQLQFRQILLINQTQFLDACSTK